MEENKVATRDSRKDKLAEWIRGWKLEPHDENDRTANAHNAAINMVIDQLYDPEESGEVDELLDSSAPNSPELTRLSGEQAEERTAREGRMSKHDMAELRKRLTEPIPWAARLMIPTETILWLLSECSRLASRVEELEKLVKIGFDGLDAIMSAPEPIGWYVSKGTMDKVEAAWRKLQNGAGAHAEEKE